MQNSRFLTAAVLMAVLMICGVLYGIGPLRAKPAMPAPLAAEKAAPPVPKTAFVDAQGGKHSIGDFKGRYVLVNLWATWCAPCVREMPSLDRLQTMLGSRLAVIAVSEDRGGAHVVDPFLEKLALKALPIYLDPKSAVGEELEISGLPTTFLIDAQGRILGQLEGAAEWDSPKMVATIERYLNGTDASDDAKTSVTR